MAKKKKDKKTQTHKSAGKVHCETILCAGFGGQGIMFMGKLLALAGLLADKYVTWMPSYGAEVRGGTAYSMTKVSDSEIANPIITDPDVLIAMNKPSFMKYEGKVKEGGIIISNKTLAGNTAKKKGVKVFNIPLTEAASKLGDVRVANMIALGVLAKRSKMLSIRNVTSALGSIFKNKEELLLKNKKALEKGYKW
ncbi:MAG: 2-oxoacid:acceptor oxidoreductase family protein [Candidatus Omnitrophica bacterium]|nr:2-oxoacid:acceptor oxidoreductase family protein [Candidatus Omnitrophota bacterium]